MSDFAGVLHCEWRKVRRSTSLSLVVAVALFTPAIIVVARLLNPRQLPALYAADDFWLSLWKNAWESMAIFFLPLAAILVTSLVAQIEFRNNAWKQVHALPLSRSALFFAKFAIVLALMALLLVLFNAAVYLSALVPWLAVRALPYPHAPLPAQDFFRDNVLYFVDCLPIVAAQYLLSLHFRNFLVPIGTGFLAWVGALAALPWKFGYLLPYTYTMLNYLKDHPSRRAPAPLDLHFLAIAYFVAFVAAGYALFFSKRQKG